MKMVTDLLEHKNRQKELEKSFTEALQEESFKELVSQIQVDRDLLLQNRTSLIEASKEYSHCKTCKNILECKNQIKGFAYLPVIKEKEITFCYKECRYKKKIDDKQRYLDNVCMYDVPREVREARMKDIYKDDKNRYIVIKYMIEFIKTYKKERKGKGLYLHGNFGCGKTYLIAAMFGELAEEGIKSAIVFWPEFLRDLKASFGTDFEEKVGKVKRAPLLLIDDIGAENTTVWARDEILCPLVQYRMSESLPTFFTSNLDLETLEKHFSMTKDKVDEVKAKRIIERIKQLAKDEKMVSENLRK